MGPAFRDPCYPDDGQRITILLINIQSTYPNLGHPDHHDSPVPSGIKWFGGALPQKTQRSPHRPWVRNPSSVVLAAPMRASSHKNDRQAGRGCFSGRPRLWGRPRRPRGVSTSKPSDRCSTRSSTSCCSCRPAAGSRKIATNCDIRTSTPSHSPPGRP